MKSKGSESQTKNGDKVCTEETSWSFIKILVEVEIGLLNPAMLIFFTP
jgi:hypothetical protein